MEVDDLFTDLADGKKLLKLLEIISGERLAKPNNGRMRVHKIENVNKSLAFLHTKVIRVPESMLCLFLLYLFVSPSASLFRALECVSLDIAHSRKPLENASSVVCARRANNFVR